MPPITPTAHVAKLNANLARTQKALDKALATWNKTGSEAAIREARALSEHRNIIRQGIKGLGGALLSPAGLAEGFAGSVAKQARIHDFKRAAREQDKPTKSGMKRVKTKA